MTEPESKKKTARETTNSLTEGVGRIVKATTETATEVSAGTVRIMADTFAGVARSLADNINNAVSESTSCAQRTVDKFISTLQPSSTEADGESTTGTTPAREPKKP